MADPRDRDASIGRRLHDRIAGLYPICRSITGDGVRETLRRIGDWIPVKTHEVPTGTRVFDWTVPREWNVREAWIAGPDGRRVVDFADQNLHLVGYSVPFRGRLPLEELQPHLHSDPDHPSWIPYRTSYYREEWGFCVADEVRRSLAAGEYEVVVDTSLADGFLTYGECVVPGDTADEFLVSTHVCHPSMCNDNLSGIVVASAFAADRAERRRRFTYRFLFVPGTIGSIAWLARNENRVGAIRHGMVLACVGDGGPPTWKRSRHGDASVDRAAAAAVTADDRGGSVIDFSPYGYDERQYGSPGFNLPVGSLMRTPFAKFAEYHSSADDLDLVRPEALADSLAICREVADALEADRVWVNLNPKCEPQLGRRGLYDSPGEGTAPDRRMAILWMLNLSDGAHSLLDIAERSGLPPATLADAARSLYEGGLLAERIPGIAAQ